MSNGVRLAVVGGGTMAQAILQGAFDAGVLTPRQILLAEPDDSKRRLFADLGVDARPGASDFPERLPDEAPVLLAVKPQMLSDAARDLGGRAGGRVVISILAGSPSGKVRAALGGDCRVIRVMPNTPARIRRGISAIAIGDGAQTGDDALALQLLEAVGEVVRIDEALMDAFTAIAGSGPAYVFYLAEAMARAGTSLGFDEAQADRLARKTIAGAGALLAQSDQSPAELRAAVTSKGGTTAAALQALNDASVQDAFVRAVTAARDRGAELSKL